MVGEAVAAALVGLAALWLVLHPLFQARKPNRPPEPLDPEETPRGVALAALKEIDFDRETGKLSEADYQFLKAKYTAAALEALRTDATVRPAQPLHSMHPTRVQEVGVGEPATRLLCRTCGPRPESDAVFCSTCGLRLAPATQPLPSSPPAAIYSEPVQAS